MSLSPQLVLKDQQPELEDISVQTMNEAAAVSGSGRDSASFQKTTINTGFKSQFTQDCMETGPTSSIGLAQRLEQMTVSPDRRRDETPPAARVSDELITKPGSCGMPLTESPTIVESSVSIGFQQTPNGYSRNHHRETPPKRRSPAFTLRAAPTRHFDLTPVTRNTSNALDDYSDDDGYCVITPEDTAGVLHGEHLALPSDLSSDVSFMVPGVSAVPKQLPERRSFAPPLPPLRACSKQRMKSVGTLDSVIQAACYQMMEEDAGLENYDPTNDIAFQPIEFPERQVYSFMSRKQFEQQQRKQLTPEMKVASTSAASTRGLTPYQPSREDLQDVGTLPEAELNSIFTNRKRENKSEFTSTSEHSSSALYATIPIEERQWSIPSIRLAHHLNESTTSNTECTDEEDDLRLDEDDESLTSRASSLYLPDEAELMGEQESGERCVAPPRVVPIIPTSFKPIVNGPVTIIDNNSHCFDFSQHLEEDTDGSNDAVEGRARHRRKKRSKKEQRAVEWLRTVEAGDDVFAEAASSKFLTGACLPFRGSGASPSTFRRNTPVVQNEAVSECDVSHSSSTSST